MSQTSPHILLVEDDYTDADLIQRCLKWNNPILYIQWVDDGTEALSYLKAQVAQAQPLPDLLIMDLKMPKRDGSDILADIKQVSALESMPIAILSSSPLEEDLTRIRQLGVDEYYVKPIELVELREVTRIILNRWRLGT